MSSMAKWDSTTWDLTNFPPDIGQCKRLRTEGGGFVADEDGSGGSEGFRKVRFRDHIWRLKQRVEREEERDCGVEEEGVVVDEMRLVQLLISCAEAVACRDRAQASAILSELEADALALGTAFQRVASCFVQGLSDRLELVHPLGAVGITALDPRRRLPEALTLAYGLCPYLRFGHLVANAAILEAFEGESSVHVVDLGMTLGLPGGRQWRKLVDSLAGRGPRRVRVTGVGTDGDALRAIGDGLEAYADGLGVRLEFSVVESSLENLRREDIMVEKGEALAVNSVLQLHCVVKESRGALNSVLRMIRELSPRVLALVEQDSGHNGPFFLGRFMEALHYYSAVFDSLDASLPRYDTKRAKVEQFYFGEEIKNIVSCEGPARVERHEKVDQWRRRMSRAGFQPAPVKMASRAKEWLETENAGEGYTVSEEKGCLVLGWKSKPIIASSCWKC